MTKRIQQLPSTTATGIKIVAVEDAAGGVTSNVSLQEIADLAPVEDSQILQRIRIPILVDNLTISDVYSDTAISATITPLSATSRIEITAVFTAEVSVAGAPPVSSDGRTADFQIWRTSGVPAELCHTTIGQQLQTNTTEQGQVYDSVTLVCDEISGDLVQHDYVVRFKSGIINTTTQVRSSIFKSTYITIEEYAVV